MNKKIISSGILLGVVAVVLGAFGAHGLQKLVDEQAVNSFKTGVTYQMYHALFLMVLGSLQQLPEKAKSWVYYLVLLGTFLFSGSIYLLATNSVTSINFKAIALVTPLGGLLLIIGWITLGIVVYKKWQQ